MRVVFFHAYPHQYAGAQRVTHELARELLARGHRPFVVTPDGGPFPERLAADTIATEIVRAPAPWRRYGGALEGVLAAPALLTLPAYWVRLAHRLRTLRADVLHCNDHRGILLAGPAARLAGIPLVWHVHGTYRSRVIALLGGLIAYRILVVSHATLGEQPALARFAGKTEVLHNGLLGTRIKNVRPSRTEGGPVVVTGARIHPEKGLDVLLRAVARLRERVSGLSLQIAGDAQDGYEAHRRELTALVTSLGLERSVRFLGAVEDGPATWAAASVYVQPSRAEPFGLAVLEAMALGVPVVTTRVGGLVELVEDGVSGLQVPPDDPDALADALAAVLTDAALARRLAAAGKERAETVFSGGRMIERLLVVYDQAGARSHKAAPCT